MQRATFGANFWLKRIYTLTLIYQMRVFFGEFMSQSQTQNWVAIEGEQLQVCLAQDDATIEKAQRLRYEVFAKEIGANIQAHDGRDIDRFDPFCHHLVVRNKANGEIVGAYRILIQQGAQASGSWYSEAEFDLSNLAAVLPKTMEVGRACVHRDYRNGSIISLLWMGLTQFMHLYGLEYMIGCASMDMEDGGHSAASLFARLKEKYYSPGQFRVYPKKPLPLANLRQNLQVETPALLKGYLRAGAWICGEPHFDEDFNAADVLVMMPKTGIHPRYAKHFLKG